jgi:hypothetical protein
MNVHHGTIARLAALNFSQMQSDFAIEELPGGLENGLEFGFWSSQPRCCRHPMRSLRR